jgi:hypothetical protein
MAGRRRGRQGKPILTVRRIMSIGTRGVLASALLAMAPSIALADISVATRWKAMAESASDCLAHAQMALFRAGFDPRDPGSQTMSGKRGDTVASIRCVPEQRVIFFVVAGPFAGTASRYLDELYGHF